MGRNGRPQDFELATVLQSSINDRLTDVLISEVGRLRLSSCSLGWYIATGEVSDWTSQETRRLTR